MGQKYLWGPGDQRLQAIRETAGRADLTVSELLRRMADYCLREPVLNTLVPSMSGRLVVNK